MMRWWQGEEDAGEAEMRTVPERFLTELNQGANDRWKSQEDAGQM